MFNAIELKSSLYATRVSSDNIDELTEILHGNVKDGILNFKVSNYEWFALEGDWILLYYTGDIQVLSDKMYNRLYKPI